MGIIHSRHPGITGTRARDWRAWAAMAAHRTSCWVNITKKMLVTDDLAQVTCKKCLKTMAQKEA